MGRKHDADVKFTCCHSQKCAKVGFSKGFLSDLIGPDGVVDTSRGQPARRRREDETMVISGETMYVAKTSKKGHDTRGFSGHSLTGTCASSFSGRA